MMLRQYHCSQTVTAMLEVKLKPCWLPDGGAKPNLMRILPGLM